MFKRLMASFVCLTFSFSNLQYVHAQDFSVNQLPVPGTMIGKSAPFAPLALKGLVVNVQKPLEFQFIVDTGRGPQDTASIKEEANQLVKYFLAGLTIPEGDLWVNLSPYEKDRMVPTALGQTDLGRDLLAQDYILKQLTASLIYPEKDLGKEFWSRVYAKAQKQFGTTNVPVNTFNKVWILPDQAQVFENVNAAYVTKSTLKVMLDEDYLSMSKHANVGQVPNINRLGSQIVREIVIPEITKEVNTGKNFAPLRQIYQALILAKWYKETIQNGLLDALYTNKNKVSGVNLNDPTVKEQIYERYLKAYKRGAFNYIKEDPTPDGQVMPRKYFSGGTLMVIPVDHKGKPSDIKGFDGAMAVLDVALKTPDAAMESDPETSVHNTIRSLPYSIKSMLYNSMRSVLYNISDAIQSGGRGADGFIPLYRGYHRLERQALGSAKYQRILSIVDAFVKQDLLSGSDILSVSSQGQTVPGYKLIVENGILGLKPLDGRKDLGREEQARIKIRTWLYSKSVSDASAFYFGHRAETVEDLTLERWDDIERLVGRGKASDVELKLELQDIDGKRVASVQDIDILPDEAWVIVPGGIALGKDINTMPSEQKKHLRKLEITLMDGGLVYVVNDYQYTGGAALWVSDEKRILDLINRKSKYVLAALKKDGFTVGNQDAVSEISRLLKDNEFNQAFKLKLLDGTLDMPSTWEREDLLELGEKGVLSERQLLECIHINYFNSYKSREPLFHKRQLVYPKKRIDYYIDEMRKYIRLAEMFTLDQFEEALRSETSFNAEGSPNEPFEEATEIMNAKPEDVPNGLLLTPEGYVPNGKFQEALSRGGRLIRVRKGDFYLSFLLTRAPAKRDNQARRAFGQWRTLSQAWEKTPYSNKTLMELFFELEVVPNDPKCIVSLPNGTELKLKEQAAFLHSTTNFEVVSFNDGSRIIILHPISKEKDTNARALLAQLPARWDFIEKLLYHDTSLLDVMRSIKKGGAGYNEIIRHSVVLGPKGNELTEDEELRAYFFREPTIAVTEPLGDDSRVFWINPPASENKPDAAMTGGKQNAAMMSREDKIELVVRIARSFSGFEKRVREGAAFTAVDLMDLGVREADAIKIVRSFLKKVREKAAITAVDLVKHRVSEADAIKIVSRFNDVMKRDWRAPVAVVRKSDAERKSEQKISVLVDMRGATLSGGRRTDGFIPLYRGYRRLEGRALESSQHRQTLSLVNAFVESVTSESRTVPGYKLVVENGILGLKPLDGRKDLGREEQVRMKIKKWFHEKSVELPDFDDDYDDSGVDEVEDLTLESWDDIGRWVISTLGKASDVELKLELQNRAGKRVAAVQDIDTLPDEAWVIVPGGIALGKDINTMPPEQKKHLRKLKITLTDGGLVYVVQDYEFSGVGLRIVWTNDEDEIRDLIYQKSKYLLKALQKDGFTVGNQDAVSEISRLLKDNEFNQAFKLKLLDGTLDMPSTWEREDLLELGKKGALSERQLLECLGINYFNLAKERESLRTKLVYPKRRTGDYIDEIFRYFRFEEILTLDVFKDRLGGIQFDNVREIKEPKLTDVVHGLLMTPNGFVPNGKYQEALSQGGRLIQAQKGDFYLSLLFTPIKKDSQARRAFGQWRELSGEWNKEHYEGTSLRSLFHKFRLLVNSPQYIVCLPNGAALNLWQQGAFLSSTMNFDVVTFNDKSYIIIIHLVSKNKHTEARRQLAQLLNTWDFVEKETHQNETLRDVMKSYTASNDGSSETVRSYIKSNDAYIETIRGSVVLGPNGKELTEDEELMALNKPATTIEVSKRFDDGSRLYWINRPPSNDRPNAAMTAHDIKESLKANPVILFVDDSNTVLAAAKDYFENIEGLKVFYASSQAEGERRIEEIKQAGLQIGLVMTDNQMPIADNGIAEDKVGLNWARDLNKRYPGIPVVLQTGTDLDSPEDARQIMVVYKDGLSDFMRNITADFAMFQTPSLVMAESVPDSAMIIHEIMEWSHRHPSLTLTFLSIIPLSLNRILHLWRIKREAAQEGQARQIPSKEDKAMNGGIDLNQINVLRGGKTVNVQFDPAQLEALQQGGFEGFTPVIINITPISSPFQLLGIAPPKQTVLAKV